MKKLACILLSLLLALALTSCDVASVLGSLGDLVNEAMSNAQESTDTGEAPAAPEASTETVVYPEISDSEEMGTDEIFSETYTEEATEEATEEVTTPPDPIDNGVLADAHRDTMKLPENMKLLQSGEANEGNKAKDVTATVVLYRLDGDVVNWTTENDLIYVITAGNNRLVMIDSATMTPVYNTPLPAVPAEMSIIGEEIYISFPDLCRIDIFSKADGQKQSSLFFDHEVSSFCLDGNVIYYSEHDQHCGVFKKDLTTGEVTRWPDGNYKTYYFPKLYLNREDGILYIGESGSTGSALYYYDAETMALLGMFEKNDYGIMNHTREIFHVDDRIFWGNYCLSDTNPKELVARYGTVDYGSMVFASEELVSTYEGLFLTDTCECIVDYFDAGSDFRYILVSESCNIFLRTRSFDTNIIVGVNFALQ